MFFCSRKCRQPAGLHGSVRRQRRFQPLVSGATCLLDDRVLLSAGGGKAAAAHSAARPLAETRAGQRVIQLFQTILSTNPSNAQLSLWVRRLQHGVRASVLRNELRAEARAERALAAAIAAPGSSVTLVSSSAQSGTATIKFLSATPATEPRASLITTPLTINLSSFHEGFVSNPTSRTLNIAITTTRGSTTSNGTSSTASKSTSATTTTLSQLPLSNLTPLGQFVLSQLASNPSALSQLGFSQSVLSQLGFSQLPVTPPPAVSSTPIATPGM